jgi:hypothetical protein
VKGSSRLIFFPGLYGDDNITIDDIDEFLRALDEAPSYSWANGNPSRVIIDNVSDASALALGLLHLETNCIQPYP